VWAGFSPAVCSLCRLIASTRPLHGLFVLAWIIQGTNPLSMVWARRAVPMPDIRDVSMKWDFKLHYFLSPLNIYVIHEFFFTPQGAKKVKVSEDFLRVPW
jgi:hypothetical protein